LKTVLTENRSLTVAARWSFPQSRLAGGLTVATRRARLKHTHHKQHISTFGAFDDRIDKGHPQPRPSAGALPVDQIVGLTFPMIG